MDEKKSINWRDYFIPDFVQDDGSTFVFGRGTKGAGQQMMLEARGWGYLNGQRCGLSEEDAMEVQRQILEVAVNALKEAWTGQTVIERLTEERDALLEYARAQPATTVSRDKQRRAALVLCEGGE